MPAAANRPIASSWPAAAKMPADSDQAERQAAVVDSLGGQRKRAPGAGLGARQPQRDRQRADDDAGHERRGVEPQQERPADQGAAGNHQRAARSECEITCVELIPTEATPTLSGVCEVGHRYSPAVAKRRLDTLLAERGLFESRSRAAAAVIAGDVRVGGQPAHKPGELVADEAEVAVTEPPPFVSRGGVKLANALDAFGVDPSGRRALDVGASTGGFTDCLLQRGAAAVVDLRRGLRRAQLAAFATTSA